MLSRMSSLEGKISTAERRTSISSIEGSSYLAALKSCSRARDIERGRQIHAAAKQSGVDSHKHIASSLVAMYMSCGSISEAQQVFDGITLPDAACWNALISGYAENGHAEVALRHFRSMQQHCPANSRTFVAAMKACSLLAAAEDGQKVDGKIVKVVSLRRGMEVHRQAEKETEALERNVYLGNALVDMYVKCRSLSRAREVFDRMIARDAVSWNVLMLGYAQNGENELAVETFWKLASSGNFQIDSWSFVAALKACGNLAAGEEELEKKLEFLAAGVAIHCRAERLDCDSNIFVANALLDMYAKCGSMVDARRVFERMPLLDVVSWNTLLLGYVENNEGELALRLFEDLLQSQSGVVADRPTLVAALKACCILAAQEQGKDVDGKILKLKALEAGMAVHSMALSSGFDLDDLYVASCLVDLYAKCGSMADSRRIFDSMKHRDTVSWNTVIAGYAQNNEGEAGLELFEAFLSGVGEEVKAKSLTFVSVFQACSVLASGSRDSDRSRALETAMALHREALLRLEVSDWDAYMKSSLVDLYVKCGSLTDASRVFSRKIGQFSNVVPWNCLILGIAEDGDGKRALKLFQKMKREGYRPNVSTYVAVLKACSSSGSVFHSRQVQAEIYREGYEKGVLAGCLVDLFGKAGDVTSAQQLFDSLQSDESEVWSALIASYSRQGDANRVLELFHEMVSSGLKPNGVTALGVLTSCSHAGFVNAGKKFFQEMTSRHGIVPEVEHFHCVVDMLIRANQRGEALALVQSRKKLWNFETNEVTWTTLTGSMDLAEQ